MEIAGYLARIGLEGAPPATLAGLRAVHRAHLRAIPYENLDVQLGRPVTIELAPIFEKIVGRGRGGWCYEMNGLLGWALGELGFDVRRATGAVLLGPDRGPSIGNHLVLHVATEDGPWLADAGLGMGPLDPFPIREGSFDAGGFSYRIERTDDGWWRFHNDARARPPVFDFDPSGADEAVLAARCAELQTSAFSPFVQNLICARFVESGVVTLTGRVLRTLTPDGADERPLASADELVAVLAETFGLDAPDAAGLWPKICARHEAVMAGAV